MAIYFVQFQVVPNITNSHHKSVEGAYAACWIRDINPQAAFNKAAFEVMRYDWKIKGIEYPITETKQEDFQGKDVASEHFHKAENHGIATCYYAWSRNGKDKYGPITLDNHHKINLNTYLSKQKKLKEKGRCYHFNAGSDCNNYIKAHSIQKKGILNNISENGEIYAISKNIADYNKNIVIKKDGIDKFSTFRGFCKKHDNELFELIDNYPLNPKDKKFKKQVILYAYRSICKELFVKENSLESIKTQLSQSTDNIGYLDFLNIIRNGIALGLKNLNIHKINYDITLKKESYNDIEYVLFISQQKPFIAFSGLLYPVIDFMGDGLQDITCEKLIFDLITFCSAPMNKGWGIIFSWHKNNSKACIQLIKSLATVVYNKGDLGDYLFRFVISNCENFAFSPIWWESLTEEQKEQISHKISSTANYLSVYETDYLMNGLEGIANWNFETVYTNME